MLRGSDPQWGLSLRHIVDLGAAECARGATPPTARGLAAAQQTAGDERDSAWPSGTGTLPVIVGTFHLCNVE